MKVNTTLTPSQLVRKIERLWELSAGKILAIEKGFDAKNGSPVFTAEGRYTTRGWTEWTQGFQFGSAILQFDATGEVEFLEIGPRRTLAAMAPHVSHIGVHDHGFNNVSTYGNLLRLMGEGRIPADPWERSFYELALKTQRRDPGRALDQDPQRRRLHLLVQRAALAVRRHHPLAARAGRRPTSWAMR